MSGIAAALILIGAAILVGLVVLVLLEPFRIDRTGDRFDYGITPDDAPRDDNDWPPDDPESFEAWMRKKYGLSDPTSTKEN